MKSLVIAFIALFSLNAFAVPAELKNKTIANENNFVIISDVDESEITVFLSYTGKQFNHCGIKLITHTFVTGGDDIKEILQIKSGFDKNPPDISELDNGYMVAKVADPNMTLFGQFFTISTKSGNPLKEDIQSLRNDRAVEVIAVNLPCE